MRRGREVARGLQRCTCIVSSLPKTSHIAPSSEFESFQSPANLPSSGTDEIETRAPLSNCSHISLKARRQRQRAKLEHSQPVSELYVRIVGQPPAPGSPAYWPWTWSSARFTSPNTTLLLFENACAMVFHAGACLVIFRTHMCVRLDSESN